MQIDIVPVVEPFDVTVNGHTIHSDIEMTEGALLSISEGSKRISPKLAHLEELVKQARERDDKAEEKRLLLKTVRKQKEQLAPIIGEEQVEAILDAATGGRSELMPYTTNILTQVTAGIGRLMGEHRDLLREATAVPERNPIENLAIIMNDTAAMRDTEETDVAQPITVAEV